MRRHPAALWRAAPGFLVLGRPDRDPITITGPGAEVWQLLAGQPSSDEMIDVLTDRYQAPHHVVAADVALLLERLQTDGFVMDDDV